MMTVVCYVQRNCIICSTKSTTKFLLGIYYLATIWKYYRNKKSRKRKYPNKFLQNWIVICYCKSILIQKRRKEENPAFLFQCSFQKGISNLLFLQPSNSLLFEKYILTAVNKLRHRVLFFLFFFSWHALHIAGYLLRMSMVIHKA